MFECKNLIFLLVNNICKYVVVIFLCAICVCLDLIFDVFSFALLKKISEFTSTGTRYCLIFQELVHSTQDMRDSEEIGRYVRGNRQTLHEEKGST